MLQFLQYKTFGSHALPEGWVIVAAGNPPAYNRSVREFDTVTLDRVRYMKVEPDFPIWKHYAVERGLHSAVLSFPGAAPGTLLRDGAWREGLCNRPGLGRFVRDTADHGGTGAWRGGGAVRQYLQDEDTATEFTFYYRLYEKWKKELKPEEILAGSRSRYRKASGAAL